MANSSFFNVEAYPGLSSIHGLETYRLVTEKAKFDLDTQYKYDPIFRYHSYQALLLALSNGPDEPSEDDNAYVDGEWLMQFLTDGAAHSDRVETTLSCQLEVVGGLDSDDAYSIEPARSIFLIKVSLMT